MAPFPLFLILGGDLPQPAAGILCAFNPQLRDSYPRTKNSIFRIASTKVASAAPIT